jgi:MFS family permease
VGTDAGEAPLVAVPGSTVTGLIAPGAAGTDAATPPPLREIWVSFGYLSTFAFVLYGLGVATPYLKTDLGLTDFQAGLHGSAMAVGVLTAGISADKIARWIGPRWLRDVAGAVMAGAIAMFLLAPALPVSLLGAVLIGLGSGTLGTDVNVRLGSAGGIETRRLMSLGNAVAMVAAAGAPVAIGLAFSGLHAWRLALILPIVSLVFLSLVRTRVSSAPRSIRLPRSRLPRGYWITWFLIVIGVSIEFSFVFWGSTIVGKRTGIANADATLLASLFVAGMLVGRLATSSRFGARQAPRLLLGAGLCTVLVGASLTWISTLPALAGLGLFLGGLGTAGLYPIGLTVALHSAPGAHLEAAARATLASGMAVLLAPSVLGLAADAVGVVAAWPITLGLGAAGLLVLAITPRGE